jgi:hypothetical protein
VPRLRAGHYLCLFGIHVFTTTLMNVLSQAVEQAGPEQLTPALDELTAQERYLALEVQGSRYNIGVKYGLLLAQLALARDGADRDGVQRIGEELLARGEVAVVTLAAGAGTRWTQGAGVVRALHPFCAFAGRHRTFLEIHLAKSREGG